MSKYSNFSPIVSSFIEFALDIGKHDPEMVINHGFGGDSTQAESPWCNCAVGEFFNRVAGFRLEGDHRFEAERLIDPMHKELLPVYTLLNSSRPETYGELKRLVEHALAGDPSKIDEEHWCFETLSGVLDNTLDKDILDICMELGTDY